VTSNKRQRELARAKAERQAARRAAEERRRRRLTVIISSVVGVLIVVGAVAFLLRPASTDTASGDSTSLPTPTDALPTPTDAPAPTDVPSGSASASSSPTATVAGCEPAPPSRPNDLSWPQPPPETIKATGTYDLTLTTNCGDVVIRLDQKAAPVTANSMVFLADQKYFDLTSCHRLVTEGIFVLQCGDPAGNGTGGPGYSIPDENLPKDAPNNYPAGTVAMANAGANTGGSQFFIVYEDTTLPPNYTIWGQVTSGLDVVTAVAAAGVEGGATDGPPAQPVSIITATTSYSADGAP